MDRLVTLQLSLSFYTHCVNAAAVLIQLLESSSLFLLSVAMVMVV